MPHCNSESLKGILGSQHLRQKHSKTIYEGLVTRFFKAISFEFGHENLYNILLSHDPTAGITA